MSPVSLSITAQVSGKETPLKAFLANLDNASWKLFVDGKLVPGQSFNPSYGFAGGGIFKMHFDAVWQGEMAPGTEFQFAILKPRSPGIIQFTFDPPLLPPSDASKQ